MSTRTTRTAKRTSRSTTPEPTPVLVPDPAPTKPSYARGNPLTHSVTFTDASGTGWLVYVEPAPPEPALWPNAAVLPGRRLRFDSLDLSVTASPFPAGAPFLPERTLQALLDQARSVAAPAAAAPSHRVSEPPARPRRVAVVPVPELHAEPVRAQLTSVVSSRTGFGYRLSRLAQPFALVLMVIRDMILPRGRG
jgi:hypothetical protein